MNPKVTGMGTCSSLHRRVGALRFGRFCDTVPVSLAGLVGLGHESAGAAVTMCVLGTKQKAATLERWRLRELLLVEEVQAVAPVRVSHG
jgi:hypothetical protein